MNASSSLDSNTTTTPASSSSSGGSVGKYIPPHRRQIPSPGPTENLNAYTFRESSEFPIDEPLLTSHIKNADKYSALTRIFDRYASQFNPIHINCFFGRLAEKEFIKRSRIDAATLDGLQRLVVKNILEFSPRQICNITWSAGRVFQNKCPFSQLLIDGFLKKEGWPDDIKVEELAMYLNGFSRMHQKIPELAREIGSYISQNLSLLEAPSTSLGAISLLASGLHTHQALTLPLLQTMIEFFHAKGGMHVANYKEIVNLLKCVVGLELFDQHFFDGIIQNLVSSRLDESMESLWYLVSIARCFADARYDHPKLIKLLRTYLTLDQIGNFHDYDLPNLAMVLSEISPEDSFREISTILHEMETRYHQSSYRRLSLDNFLQACWALACTKTDNTEPLFLEAVAFTLEWAKKNIEQVQPIGRFQLYQIALLADREDIVSQLELEGEGFIHDFRVSVSQQQIADILTSRGYKLTIEQKVRGFSFDIVMKNHLDQLVIVEVDGVYHFTCSGKERGATRLQSQLIRKLGYPLIRVNLMMQKTLEWHADEICKQLALSSHLADPCPKQPGSEGCFDSLALT